MTIYFLFGKTGAGKSHLGELLERLGITHVDGDKHITQRMRDCLIEDEQITREMVDEFVAVMIGVINDKKTEAPKQSFVVSQAMYLDHHRCKLLDAIPDLKFVMVQTPSELRANRIRNRFLKKESKVSLSYANQMDKFFENPTHEIIPFENNQESEEALIEKIHEKMPALFNRELQRDNHSDVSLQLA